MPPMANRVQVLRNTTLRIRKHISLTMGAVVVLAVVATALIGPRLTPYNPERSNLDEKLLPPVWQSGTFQHPLGTDGMGRDMVSLLIAGARTSLLISFSAVFLTLLIGCTVGLVAGFLKGLVGELLMRLVDLQMSFPYFLLAITVASVTKPNLLTLIAILSLADWVVYARLVRGMILQESEKDYVQAGIVVGASRARIATRYALPQVLPSIVVIDSRNGNHDSTGVHIGLPRSRRADHVMGSDSLRRAPIPCNGLVDYNHYGPGHFCHGPGL